MGCPRPEILSNLPKLVPKKLRLHLFGGGPTSAPLPSLCFWVCVRLDGYLRIERSPFKITELDWHVLNPHMKTLFFFSSKSMYETWGLLLKAMMPMDVPISNCDFMGELYFTKVHFSFMKIFHIHQQNFIHSHIGNS
jgi:hypothetical protein